jgi:DNA processing protein
MALTEMGGVGPRTFQQLLMRLGPPENMLNAGPEDLDDIPRLGDRGPEKILKSLDHLGEFDHRIERFRDEGVEAITYFDDNYPEMLREIGDPPPIIYVRGDIESFKYDYIAIVGTTQANQSGIRLTVDLAREFVGHGFGIVSGLASGIDSAAHLSALKSNGRTIAVLGCGIFNIYPAENSSLADNIAASGLLVSEYSPERRVKAMRLVLRNRLISAFSRAVIVTQVGTERRGELRTAHYAAKQGKPLFIADPEGVLDSETIENSHASPIRGIEAVDEIIKYMV